MKARTIVLALAAAGIIAASTIVPASAVQPADLTANISTVAAAIAATGVFDGAAIQQDTDVYKQAQEQHYQVTQNKNGQFIQKLSSSNMDDGTLKCVSKTACWNQYIYMKKWNKVPASKLTITAGDPGHFAELTSKLNPATTKYNGNYNNSGYYEFNDGNWYIMVIAIPGSGEVDITATPISDDMQAGTHVQMHSTDAVNISAPKPKAVVKAPKNLKAAASVPLNLP